jgi:hypothetical protein
MAKSKFKKCGPDGMCSYLLARCDGSILDKSKGIKAVNLVDLKRARCHLRVWPISSLQMTVD